MMAPFSLRQTWIDATLAIAAFAIFALAILGGLPRLRNDSSIRIATALLPPQVNENGEGREAEIIIAALRGGGITKPIQFHVMPFTRHWQLFKTDTRYHAVTTVPTELELDGLRSDTYIEYQNGAIYRLDMFPDGLGMDPLQLIQTKRVVAFAGATTILPSMKKVSEVAPVYLERQDQASHSIMFSNKIVDIVIADELIFDYYNRKLPRNNSTLNDELIEFDPIFCPTPYQVIFRDVYLRDAFNRGLQLLRSNGTLRSINRKYELMVKVNKSTKLKTRC